MVGGFLTNHSECHNGAIAACGMDKSLGQTHATELALIHIPKGTLMVEGGHAHAYETVMRCSQPYSMVTAAQRTAVQAMGAVQDEIRTNYQVEVQEVSHPRSRMNMNAGEDLPVLQQVRYAGNQPTLQQVETEQKRRQQAAGNGQHGQKCAEGLRLNNVRKDRKDTGEQGWQPACQGVLGQQLPGVMQRCWGAGQEESQEGCT